MFLELIGQTVTKKGKHMTDNEETVTISNWEYQELLESARMLDALICAGVDSWDGYEMAQEMLANWDEAE